MRSTPTLLAFICTGAIVTASQETNASTKKPLGVVLEFRGWKGNVARKSAEKGVATHAHIISKDRLKTALLELGASPYTPIGMARLIEDLRVHVLIEGTVTGEGPSAFTTVQVFGPDGRRLAKWVGQGPRGGKSAIKAGTASAVKEAIKKLETEDVEPSSEIQLYATRAARAPRASMEAPSDETEEGDGQVGVEVGGESDESTDAVAVTPTAPSTPPPSKPSIKPDDEEEVIAKLEPAQATPPALISSSTSRRIFLADQATPQSNATSPAATNTLAKREPLDVSRSIVVPKDETPELFAKERFFLGLTGITMRRRTAAIDLSNDFHAKHDSGMFPELTLLARAHPFDSSSGVLSGLFAELEGSLAVGLSSLTEEGEQVSTSAYRFRFATGYTYDLGMVQVGGGVGLGMDSFSLGDNEVLGSSAYTFLRPGLIAKLEVVENAFNVQLDAGFRAVLSTGELPQRYLQTASATGFDVAGSLLGSLDVGFSYELRVGYTHYGLTFGELVAPTLAEEDIPVSARGGSDSSVTLMALFGWKLH